MSNKSILTKQSVSFSDWYTDVVKLAELADYGPVKGTMIIRPYGYAIWENIQRIFDGMIKEKGIENAYFPLFIPESFLNKEKEHVEGFSPELAVVTIAGGEKLTEPIVIRPTSETIMYDTFSRWISSYRDLPFHINQWCNIVRWEKKTKPFIRTSEFLWQEGHSVLATEKEVDELTHERLVEYRKFIENTLAIPLYVGKKSESEKFAGAVYTLSTEALLKDGKALQSATSHNLGQNFSKVFDIQFEDKDGKRKYGWQSSWGMTTRMIGALILTHGDDKGLILPPLVAPTQAVIIPIFKDEKEKKAVIAEAEKIKEKYKGILRIKIDDRDNMSFGWKSTEWEIKGVPLRIEIGPKDLSEKSVMVVKRNRPGKNVVKISNLDIEKELYQIQEELYTDALNLRNSNTHKVDNYESFKKDILDKKGFYLASWCGGKECEAKIKEETSATTRVIPENMKVGPSDKCFHCSDKAKYKVYFAKAY